MAIISGTRQRASGSSTRRAAVAYHFGGCARAKKNLHALSFDFIFFSHEQMTESVLLRNENTKL